MSLDFDVTGYCVQFFESNDENSPWENLRGFEDCLVEVWTRDSVIHREGAPAVTLRDVASGEVVHQEYLEHGVHHRLDGPAIESLRRDLGHRSVEFLQDGQSHSSDNPRLMVTSLETGVVIYEDYVLNDLRHRDGGLPAVIRRDPYTGVVVEEGYWVNGEPYRADGPTIVKRDPATGLPITSDDQSNSIATASISTSP